MSLSDTLRLLAPFAVAPLLYPAVGLVWARATGSPHLAALLGVAVHGLTAELSYIANWPVPVAAGIVTALHLVALPAVSRRAGTPPVSPWHAWGAFLPFYLVALVPLAVAPFALPGRWSLDWALALESGRAIYSGADLPPIALMRPPLFVAATAPLWTFAPSLPAYQALCAVGCGAMLQIFSHGLPAAAPRGAVWLLGGCTMFLQNTAACWAKLPAAAFLMAAWFALAGPSAGRRVVAALLTGCALATHQATVLFTPLLLLRASADLPWRGYLRARIVRALGFAAVASIVVLPWEVSTIARHGLAAKASVNPALGDRPDAIPGWANTLLVGVTTFVAWGPIEPTVAMIREDAPRDARFFVRFVFWNATSLFNTLAGTIAGVIIPFGIALGTRRLKAAAGSFWHSLGWDFRLALILALAGQMILNPYYSPDGSLQTGFVPAGIACLLWLARHVARTDPTALRRAVILTLITATIPWLLFEAALAGALALSAEFAAQFRDADLVYLRDHGHLSIGLHLFPLGVGFAAIFLATEAGKLRLPTVNDPQGNA